MTGVAEVLCINEGATPGIQGHQQVAVAMQAAIDAEPRLAGEVVDLAPASGWQGLLARPVPFVGRYDLDLQILRWHLVHGRAARRLVAAEARTRRPDVLVVNSHAIALRLGAAMAQLPTVLLVDATVEQWSRFGVFRRWEPWSRALLTPSLAMERRRFAQAAAVVASSSWAAAGVRRACPDATVVEVHPGLDLERFHPAPKAPRAVPRLLFVGGRFEAKGGLDLLHAVGPALDAGTVELDVVTTSPLPARTGVHVHQARPGDAALLELFRQADLFVLPSHAEGCPWVVLEAMASGTPVLATPVGAVAEQVGEGGRLVPVGDRGALRHELDELLGDADLLARLGVQARGEVEARYDRHRQATRLGEAFLAAAT